MINNISQQIGGNIYHIFRKEDNNLKEIATDKTLIESSTEKYTIANENISDDTIIISEEAYKLSEKFSKGSSGEEESNSEDVSEIPKSQSNEEGNATDPIEQLRKQIKEIQEKLQDAQAKLLEVQSSTSKTKTEPGEDPSEAAMKAAVEALTGNVETESIQSEIKMLEQQLLMLNEQLQEAMQGKGASVA